MAYNKHRTRLFFVILLRLIILIPEKFYKKLFKNRILKHEHLVFETTYESITAYNSILYCPTFLPIMQQQKLTLCILYVATLLLALTACATRIESADPASESASGTNQENNSFNATYGSCSLELTEDTSTEEAIQAVLRAEGQFVVDQNIDALMALWIDGSYIKNAKNTVDDKSDDQLWSDVDAIRHRYVRTVFPGAPTEIQPANLQIELDGDNAVVIATTRIGDEISPSGDRWELTRQNDCWLIQSLAYNLEPN